jgi:hypothetical protein
MGGGGVLADRDPDISFPQIHPDTVIGGWQISRSDIVSSPNLKNKFTMTWIYHMAMF